LARHRARHLRLCSSLQAPMPVVAFNVAMKLKRLHGKDYLKSPLSVLLRIEKSRQVGGSVEEQDIKLKRHG